MSKNNRADEALLSALHGLLAEHFRTILANGETEMAKDGTLMSVSPKPATLNAIRQFLKDNGIEALADSSEATRNLASELAELEANDGSFPIN